MGPDLVSIIFTSVAVVGAYVAAPKGGGYGLMRICGYWLVVTVCVFLSPYKLLAFLAAGIALVIISQRSPASAAILYIATFCAVPDYYHENIPFPGLNYLIDVNHAKIATLFLLGPLFFAKVFAPASKKLRAVDVMLLVFVVLTGVMSLRDLPFTSMLRTTLNQFLLIYVPYIVISRSLVTQEDINNAVKAVFVLAAISAGIGIISLAVYWNYYINLDDNPAFKAFMETRNGLLRIYATYNTPLLSLVAGCGVVCALSLSAAKALPRHVLFVVAPLLGFVAFATGSRGGLLSALLAGISYMVFTRMKAGMRKLYLATLLMGFVGGIVMIMQDSTVLNDEYGTYSYRADLLRTSIPQIAKRPLFGSSDFLETPEFEALRQGEGIIDLVNAYLQVTLYYGFTGLALFLGANLTALKSALRALSEMPDLKNANEGEALARRNLSVLLAFMIGFMGLIATTSGVSFIWNFGYIFLALLVAQTRVIAAAKTLPLSSSTSCAVDEGADQAGMAGDAEPRERIPYGARFVRRI